MSCFAKMVVLLGGCGLLAVTLMLAASCIPATKQVTEETAPVPTTEPTAKMLGNLDELSPTTNKDPYSAHAVPDFESLKVIQQLAAASPTASPDMQSSLMMYLSKPTSYDYQSDKELPGEVGLLNRKASQYALFCQNLLHQVYSAIQDKERTSLRNLATPRDIVPVILTATMDKDGSLTELIIEQRSGSGIVDRAVIESAKKGLFFSNPPPGAADDDGLYHLRLEALVKNLARRNEGGWNFTTTLGLGLN